MGEAEDSSFLNVIQGNWVAIGLEVNGVLSTEHVGDGVSEAEHRAYVRQYGYEFEGRYFRSVSPDSARTGTFELDETQTPLAIDLAFGGNLISPGILKFENDQILLCLAPPGQARPRFFKTSSEGQEMLFVLERESEP